MFVWLITMIYRSKIQKDDVCNDAANWFSLMYLYIGVFFAY